MHILIYTHDNNHMYFLGYFAFKVNHHLLAHDRLSHDKLLGCDSLCNLQIREAVWANIGPLSRHQMYENISPSHFCVFYIQQWIEVPSQAHTCIIRYLSYLIVIIALWEPCFLISALSNTGVEIAVFTWSCTCKPQLEWVLIIRQLPFCKTCYRIETYWRNTSRRTYCISKNENECIKSKIITEKEW